VSFVAGCVVGALATALLLLVGRGLVDPLQQGVRVAGFFVASTVLLLGHFGIGVKPPQSAKQIPPSVVAAGGPRSAFNFAVIYGTGLFTFLPSVGPHIVATYLLFLGQPHTFLVAGLGFGLGRGLPLLSRAFSIRRTMHEDLADRALRVMSTLGNPAVFAGCAWVASHV